LTVGGTVEAPAKPARRRSLFRRAAPLVLGVAFVGFTFGYVLPKIADYGAVWDAIRSLSWQEIMLLVVLTVLNILTFAPPFMAALPGLRFFPALTVTLGSNASTYVLPGAGAVGMGFAYAMLRARGFDAAGVALAVTLTGIWNQFFLFAAPAFALGLLTLEGTRQHGLLLFAGIIGFVVFLCGVGVFAAALASTSLARWVGDRAARFASWVLRVVRRKPVAWAGQALVTFRLRALGLLRRRWWQLTLATLAGQGTVFFVLLGCLRSLGVSAAEVNASEALGAWSVARLIASLPFTPPGGLGVVELSMTGLLIGFGGHASEVTAAVLLYRFLTVVPTLGLGTIAVLGWKRHPAVPAG
jgi:putative heme transporter